MQGRWQLLDHLLDLVSARVRAVGQFSTLGWGGLGSGFEGVLDRALVERAVQQRAHVGVHGRQHLVRVRSGVRVRG